MTASSLRRFAVLPLAPRHGRPRYALFDRLTGCIVDGVYLDVALALEVATYLEECGIPPTAMTPTAEALGLLFPLLASAQEEAP